MSYDLYFVGPELCDDPAAIYERLENDDGAASTPEREARKRNLAALLQRANPELSAFPFDYEKIAQREGTTVQQARERHSHVELNGPDGGNRIQITLFSEYASITVPYWHDGPKAESVFSELQQYATVLVRDGGYRIYDPQLDRVVETLDAVRDEVLGRYGSVMAKMPGILASAKQKKPWWKFW